LAGVFGGAKILISVVTRLTPLFGGGVGGTGSLRDT
jgi:hypothetical protein